MDLKIQTIPKQVLRLIHDIRICSHYSDSIFTYKYAYEVGQHLLVGNSITDPPPQYFFPWIRSLKALNKMKYFIFAIYLDRLLTNAYLSKS